VRRWFVLVSLVASACNEPNACVQGAQQACACGQQQFGIQVCNADGTFGACTACAPMLDAFAADAPPIDAPADAPPDAPPVPAPTGGPCSTSTECAGGGVVQCLTNADGLTWTGGYCSAACDVGDADFDGFDPDCPGSGFCVNLEASAQCLATCSAMTGPNPCRTGYSCFSFGCAPSGISQCDPTVVDSCEAVPGGGVCRTFGLDPVGQCIASCDVFAQDCVPGDGCYVVNTLGDTGCMYSNDGAEGTFCLADTDCAPGTACIGNLCAAFCGGPSNVACATGTCVGDGGIPSSTIGVCQ